MTIETMTQDGRVIAYGYDPEHRESLVKFYDDLVTTGAIVSYRIR